MIKKISALLFFTLIFNNFVNLAFAGPQSTTYEIKDYSFGGGGTSQAGVTGASNYTIFGTLGEIDATKLNGASLYSIGGGLTYTLKANVPAAPSITNPSSYYNKLKIIIDNGSNASDATFAIAISTDNFVSDTTHFIQANNTIGTSMVFQSYTAWNGATGFNVINLAPNTSYTIKVAAYQGNFTQSGYSATAQAATIAPTLSFDIDVSPSDTETAPPYQVDIGSLLAGTVITASNKVWVDLDTNGTAGGTVYVFGSNNGLLSSTTGTTIGSATTDLSSAQSGYGAKFNSVAQTSGGPIEALSPYNGASNNVGILDTNKRIIFDSTNAPVTAGRASFLVKAKATTLTRPAQDYTDTLTVVASASF